MARALAKQGINVYRFDYTGAGDSEGKITEFTDIQADIEAAVDHFQQLQPQLTELILWGLCDAASAILLYLAQQPKKHAFIHRLVLVNPWIRQPHTQAHMYMKSYYIKRFFSQRFWKKLLTGKVNARNSLSELHDLQQQSKQFINPTSFVSNMLQVLHDFEGEIIFILSGNDLTADEFKLLVNSNVDWQALMSDTKISQETIKCANHTFSSVDSQKALLETTLAALLYK